MRTGNKENIAALGLYTAGGLFWAFLPIFTGLNVSSGGFSQAQAGALGSGYLIGFSTASLTALWWLNRFSRRTLAACAAVLVVAALLSLARVEDYGASLAIVCAIGLAMGIFWSIAYRIFSESSNPERGFAIGIVVSYTALALISFIMGGHIAPRFGLSGAGYFLAALVLLLGLSAFALPRGGMAGGSAASASVRLPPLSILLALAGILGTSFAFAAIWAFVERIGVGAGFDAARISPVIAANLLAAALGSLAATALAARAGRAPPLSAGMLFLLIAVAALALPAGFWLYAAAVAGLGFAIGFVLPYQMGNLAALDKVNEFVPLIAAAQGIGSALGPWLGGVAADIGGFGLLLAAAAAVIAVSAVMTLVTLRAGGAS